MRPGRAWVACCAVAWCWATAHAARAQSPSPAVWQDAQPDVVVEAQGPDDEDPLADAGARKVVGAAAVPIKRAQSLPDALAQVPGVRVVHTGGPGAGAGLDVRGLRGRRVATYLGPVRLDDPATGALDLSEIPVAALGSAQLITGATSVTEGALGGALMLQPAAPLLPVARGSLTVGSEALWQLDAAAGAPFVHGPVAGGVTAVVRYGQTNGRFAYTPVVGPLEAPVVLGPRMRINNDRRRLGFTLVGAGEWLGGVAVTGVVDVSYLSGGIAGFGVQPLPRARQEQTRTAAGVTLALPALRRIRTSVEVAGRGAAWRFEDRKVDGQVRGGLLTGAVWTQAVAQLWVLPGLEAETGLRTALDVARANQDLGGWQAYRPTVGAHTAFRLYTWHGRIRAEGRVHTTAWLVHTQGVGAPMGVEPRWAVNPEMRVALAPWRALELHASVAKAWRTPSLEELYRPQTAPLGGNPALNPEDGVEAAVGMRFVSGPLTAVAQAYAARMFNVIAYVNINAFDVRPQNVGHAWRAGGETQLRLALGAWGEVYAGGELHWSRVLATGAPIPAVPLWQWTGGVRLGPPQVHLLADATVRTGASGNFYGELPIRPASRINGGLEITVMSGTHVQVMVRNLTDERAQTDVWGVPLPGREAFVTVAVDPGAVLLGGEG